MVGEKMYIFGGELVPRQPVDNKIDVVKVGGELGRRNTEDLPFMS